MGVQVEMSVNITDQCGKLPEVIELWELWCLEEGQNPDPDYHARELVNLYTGMLYINITAHDGDRMVGYMGGSLEYDSRTSETICYAQQAYVLPEYRSQGVFSKLVQGAEYFAHINEADACKTMSNNDEFLLDLYNKHGYATCTHCVLYRRKGE
jgi:GNAT superfamily N-acetyltransferase